MKDIMYSIAKHFRDDEPELAADFDRYVDNLTLDELRLAATVGLVLTARTFARAFRALVEGLAKGSKV